VQYPTYGFAQHKGYGTAQHLAALRAHGASPLHRKTFSPVRAVLASGGGDTGSHLATPVASIGLADKSRLAELL
jgi:hypothetical protein